MVENIWKSAPLLLTVALSIHAAASAQTMGQVLKIEAVSTKTVPGTSKPAETGHITTYIASDGRRRVEAPDPVRLTTKIHISIPSENTIVVLDTKTKTAVKMVGFGHADGEKSSVDPQNRTSLGTQRIMGFPCNGFSSTQTTRGFNGVDVTVSNKYWNCTDAATGVTFVGHSELTNGTFVMTNDVTSVNKNVSVPEDIFRIPSGYTVTVRNAP